jgi:hypothetical protein
MLLGLDAVLEVFKEAKGTLTPDELELKFQLALMRAHVLRAESGHPFPAVPPSQLSRNEIQAAADPTPAPWQT